MALICVAGLSFIYLSVWNTETIPTDLADYDIKGILILLLSFAALQKKVSLIPLLFGSGVVGLILGVIIR